MFVNYSNASPTPLATLGPKHRQCCQADVCESVCELESVCEEGVRVGLGGFRWSDSDFFAISEEIKKRTKLFANETYPVIFSKSVNFFY